MGMCDWKRFDAAKGLAWTDAIPPTGLGCQGFGCGAFTAKR